MAKENKFFSSKQFEYFYLLAFITLFLYIGLSDTMGRRLNNDYPVGLLASDPFHYYNYVEGLDERGKFDYFPYYISFNLSTMVAYQPPLFFTNAAIIGNVFDTANYNALHIMMVIFLSAGIILMYFLIRRYNKNVAILSLPLALFIALPNFNFGILWGRQPTMWTEVFLIALFWLLPKIKDYKHGLTLAVIVSSLFLGHVPQLLFGVVFIAVFYVIDFVKNKKIPLRILVLAVLLTIIFCAMYFSVFNSTIAKASPFKTQKALPTDPGNRFVAFSQFSYFGILIVIGVAVWLISKKKMGILFAVFMLLIGFTNYFLGKRGIEVRFMWPVFLMALFGLGIYLCLIKLRSKMISYACSIVVIIVFLSTIYAPFGSSSIAPPYMWDMLQSFHETPERSKVLFLYFDLFDQSAMLLASKRLTYVVRTSDLMNIYVNGTFPREAMIAMHGESQSKIAYKKNSKIYFYSDEAMLHRPMDVCGFDYYVFGKAGRSQELVNLNNRLAYGLEGVEVFFDNQYLFVLRNNNPGADCIPKEGMAIE